MGKIAFLFAGQGAQAPGMGRALCEAFPRARQAMEAFDARRPGTMHLCFEGTAEALQRTDNTQPCLFAVDWICAMAAVEEAGIRPDCAAGFSLGEWAAVSAAGMLSKEDAFDLVCLRGDVMQRCNDAHPGAMAAVLKLTSDQVEALCENLDGAYPVNYNCPGQTVVACQSDQLAEVTAYVKAAGGRCLPLKVGGSFHTPVMAPATEALRKALAERQVHAPNMPVYANLTGQVYGADAREALAMQASHPVRWEQTILNMWDAGVDTFIEFGPGTTLAGLVKRTKPEARTASVSDPASLEACAAMLKEAHAL